MHFAMDYYALKFVAELHDFIQSPLSCYPKFKNILYEEFLKTQTFRYRLDFMYGEVIATSQHHQIPDTRAMPVPLPRLHIILRQWFYLLDCRMVGELDESQIPPFYEQWAQMYERMGKLWGFETLL